MSTGRARRWPARIAPPCDRPRSCRRRRRSPRSTGTPRARSIRSVWSRVATGSRTVVRPSARQPRQQDRRLDLGARDRRRVVDGRAAAVRPMTVRGREGVVPAAARSAAPIAAQRLDDTSRSVGRRNEASPSRTRDQRAARPATPAIRRRLVPELPQSRIADRARVSAVAARRHDPVVDASGRPRRRAPRVAPRRATTPGRRADVRPVAGARRSGSRPRRAAASSSARWLIDLSPGSAQVVRAGVRPGRTRRRRAPDRRPRASCLLSPCQVARPGRRRRGRRPTRVAVQVRARARGRP